ncbi:MAG: copper-binding protein [Rhodospirillaceae bacterium]|nr:copper-binding protein [Rhodospirillaceae bacterium]
MSSAAYRRDQMHSNTFKTTALAALAALFAFTVAAHGAIAAGSHSGGHDNDKGHGHSMAIGEPGDPAKADRTIAITMSDNFFEPEEIKIKEGEPIRFVVSNKGEFLHEFNIGTAAMHAAHQKEMAEMMEHGMITATGIDHKMMKMDHGGGKMMMEHNDPNSVLLEPGKQAEVIWRFTKEAELEFACNVPGHYESGMMGPIHMQHGH